MFTKKEDVLVELVDEFFGKITTSISPITEYIGKITKLEKGLIMIEVPYGNSFIVPFSTVSEVEVMTERNMLQKLDLHLSEMDTDVVKIKYGV